MMIMYSFSYLTVAACGILFSALPASEANPILCTPPMSPTYEAVVANRTATFHMNFNKPGGVGKQANANMISVSMDWDSDNVFTLGRKAFVAGLMSFDEPFPGIQIVDELILNDGNLGAIFYYFQGTQGGEFMGIPASGNKVEAANGELMVYDEDALLNRLISVNELDRLEMEAKGQIKISKFGSFPRISNPQTPLAYRQKIKNVAAQFNKNFNLGNTAANAALVTPNVAINSDNVMLSGRTALVNVFGKYKTAMPDLIAHDEYILGDGHWAATEFIWQGTRTGPFKSSNGTIIPPDGKSYRTHAMRFMKFNDAGLVEKFWQVSNNNDFLGGLQT